jgi:hypothetical protein
MGDLFVQSGATLSPCGKYRYRLWRIWDDHSTVAVWVMLNPSTADADVDDPTIRRCLGFSRAWGYGGIIVVNLFAWRATDQSELDWVDDPVGPENDAHITACVGGPVLASVIAAWGKQPVSRRRRATEVLTLIRSKRGNPGCLGVNTDGSPKHPLYLAATTTLRQIA